MLLLWDLGGRNLLVLSYIQRNICIFFLLLVVPGHPQYPTKNHSYLDPLIIYYGTCLTFSWCLKALIVEHVNVTMKLLVVGIPSITWPLHNHHSCDSCTYILHIQQHPYHIGHAGAFLQPTVLSIVFLCTLHCVPLYCFLISVST